VARRNAEERMRKRPTPRRATRLEREQPRAGTAPASGSVEPNEKSFLKGHRAGRVAQSSVERQRQAGRCIASACSGFAQSDNAAVTKEVGVLVGLETGLRSRWAV
jgi:hypothetical protein